MAKTYPWDAAEHLDTDQAIQEYLKDVLATEDPGFIVKALGTIARAKGMTAIAQEAGVTRTSLYAALSGDGNPAFATILSVMKALDLKFSLESRSNAA